MRFSITPIIFVLLFNWNSEAFSNGENVKIECEGYGNNLGPYYTGIDIKGLLVKDNLTSNMYKGILYLKGYEVGEELELNALFSGRIVFVNPRDEIVLISLSPEGDFAQKHFQHGQLHSTKPSALLSTGGELLLSKCLLSYTSDTK